MYRPVAYYLNDCDHTDSDECVPQLSGDVLCPDCYRGEEYKCTNDNDQPVFDLETDTPEHCDECFTLLDGWITREGMRHVAEQVAEAIEQVVTYEQWHAMKDQLALPGMEWSEPHRPNTTVVYQWWAQWNDDVTEYLDAERVNKALGFDADHDDPWEVMDAVYDALEGYSD